MTRSPLGGLQILGTLLGLALFVLAAQLNLVSIAGLDMARLASLPRLTDSWLILGIDNGPPFNGYKFADYAKQQGFVHQKVTPKWAQANGHVERFMRNLGKVLRNASSSEAEFEFELNEFLRNYRSTPHSSSRFPPQQLLLQSNTRTTRLPALMELTVPVPVAVQARANDLKAKEKIKSYNDTNRRAMDTTLKLGDTVLLKSERRLKSDPLTRLPGKSLLSLECKFKNIYIICIT
jgi:hypothetical protein